MSKMMIIEDCDSCPHRDDRRVYTGDSFEMVFDYLCSLKGSRKVGQRETFDDPIKPPKWCPLPNAPRRRKTKKKAVSAR